MQNDFYASNQRMNRNNTVPVFAYMGDFNIEKFGIDTILLAFADYKNKYLEAGSLWLIGEGKDKNKIVETVRTLEIGQFVHIKQLPSGNAKINLLSQVDLFLRPSRTEFFPTAIIEAASVSVPSIVSAESIISEHIRTYNAGFVMEEHHYKHLAKLLLKTLNEIKYHQWSSMRRNSFRMATEKFQWNKIIKTYNNLFEHQISAT